MMQQLKGSFPSDLDYAIGLDTSKPVTAGMKEIATSLVAAMILVILVVFLFLQNWRATLIPLIAVPVSLIGTFAFFPFLGFSINTLSLFGLVLAIGLVVDDAIVVVEAVEHHIEAGMSPREATLKAMSEVSGPVVGIALVLSSVFIPIGLMSGIQGRLNKQFAMTIAISVVISAFNALSLSPALSAMILKPRRAAKGPLARFFGVFNRGFARATRGYVDLSSRLIRKTAASLLILAGFVVLAIVIGRRLPTGFIPDEDQGYLLMNVQLPDAASFQRTVEVTQKIEKLATEVHGVRYVTTINGFSLLTRTSDLSIRGMSAAPPRCRRKASWRRSTATCVSVCRRPSPSRSRLRRSRASAPREDSPSGSRTGAAARWSSWPRTSRNSSTPPASDPSWQTSARRFAPRCPKCSSTSIARRS